MRHLTSHWLSFLAHEGKDSPEVHMNFFFHSHVGLVHVLIEWHRMPLLVFSNYPKVENVKLEVLRDATTLEVYRQHVALGIRAGQSTLFAFEFQGARYLMIGVLMASKVPQKVGQENRHWKHVALHQTELAILPREMAEFFFLLGAAWVRSRAERPSVSYTKVTGKITRTGHILQ